MSSFENFQAGMANLRAGFNDYREAKEKKAELQQKQAKADKEQANIKAVSDMIRAGQVAGIPEGDRAGVASLVEKMGNTVFGKVFAMAAGEGLPSSIEGLLVHSAVQMNQGQKSGDKATYDAGMQGMTQAMNLFTEVSKARKVGTELGKAQFTVGGKGGGKGDGKLVSQVIMDPSTGEVQVVGIDKKVLSGINQQLRGIGIGGQDKIREGESIRATRGAAAEGKGVFGVFKSFVDAQSTDVRTKLLHSAIKAGYGKVISGGTPEASVPATKANNGPIKIQRDPTTGQLIMPNQ